jgi:uncharacterized protein (TIGR01244 family)
VINAFQVNEYLTTTGQVIPEQLKQAVQEGFKSVLNLRSPDELGFLPDEQQVAESLGLHYVNLPFKLDALDEMLITQILTVLDQIPKPAVIHCAASIRSTTIALLSVAIQEGLTPEQILARAKEMGYKFAHYACIDPELKQFFSEYLLKHAKVPASVS